MWPKNPDLTNVIYLSTSDQFAGTTYHPVFFRLSGMRINMATARIIIAEYGKKLTKNLIDKGLRLWLKAALILTIL